MKVVKIHLVEVLLPLAAVAPITEGCEHLRLGGSGDSLEDVRVEVKF